MSNPINLPSCVLCQVPEGLTSFHISNGRLVLVEDETWAITETHTRKLPPGNYGTPFLASEANPKQAYEYLPITTCIDYNLNPSTTVVIPKK